MPCKRTLPTNLGAIANATNFCAGRNDAFERFRVIPPGNGILHQINLELLAQVVWTSKDGDGTALACPDAMVGMDSHTPMINGLGVLGWGVGGIEALAAMLGQPLPLGDSESDRLPSGREHCARRDDDRCRPDAHASTPQTRRRRNVHRVHRTGLDGLRVAERATLANMAPEYGATVGYFPIDAETLRYLRLTGRAPEQVDLVETYAKAQGLWRDATTPEPCSPTSSSSIWQRSSRVSPVRAGRRTVSRSRQVPASFKEALPTFGRRNGNGAHNGEGLRDGDVVIAARYELHEHVQSIGDDRRRTARSQRRRARVCARSRG